MRRHVVRHAAVDHRDRHVLGAGEQGERQLVREGQLHRFVRGARGGVADAVDRQAMVGREHQQLRIVQHRLQRVLHQAQADGQRLELAEAAAYLIAARELLAQGFFEQGARGGGD
jgi:hypothetical protein